MNVGTINWRCCSQCKNYTNGCVMAAYLDDYIRVKVKDEEVICVLFIDKQTNKTVAEE